MKIEFVDGESSWNGKWNIRLVLWRGQRVKSRGTFIPAGNIDIEFKEDKMKKTIHNKNHIVVIRQPTKVKTALILLHELCHWLVNLIFRHNHLARRKWHNKIDKYL